MQVLLFLAVSAIILGVAYVLVGNWLERLFRLSRTESETPAHTMRDGLDYEPATTAALLPQHFSAIAAAGPIVGPILAALYFGWGPAWLWIIFGSILIGGIHDFTCLLASVRHKARSVAELVREYMTPRAYFLFLVFIWFALVYVIIAFADVTAGTFVATASATSGDAPGPAVATSSVLYLGLAVLMGVLIRTKTMSPTKAKLVCFPLLVLAIVGGPMLPLDLGGIFGANTQRAWGVLLLIYCFVAAMSPVWALLQPRGELGGYFLYIVMGVAVVGIAIGAASSDLTISQPAFKGWMGDMAATKGAAMPLFPMLFITIACGACSGFHSIVASGTTSKQLHRECDAKAVGYGSMLLEGFLACISLTTLMVMTEIPKGGPNVIYATGIAQFGDRIARAISSTNLYPLLYQFALLCFATFVFDTLDACTRLARYVLMELMGWETRAQGYLATGITLLFPLVVMLLPPVLVDGQPRPLWQIFWNIFGSSNQLLAALALLAVTVWLAKKGMAWWLTLVPTVFMMAMTLWSLVMMVGPYLTLVRGTKPVAAIQHLQFAIVVSLIVLSVWLVVEALLTWRTMVRPGTPSAGEREALPEGA